MSVPVLSVIAKTHTVKLMKNFCSIRMVTDKQTTDFVETDFVSYLRQLAPLKKCYVELFKEMKFSSSKLQRNVKTFDSIQ